jgi:hypothetical protein
MDPAATLLSLCQVAVSIAGFAGIAFAIASKGSSEDDLMRRWRLRFMVAASIGAVGCTCLPVSLLALGLPERSVWVIASATLAVANPLFIWWTLLHQRRFLGIAFFRGTFVNDVVFITLNVVSSALALFNALGVGFHREFGAYLIAVLVWFVFSLSTFFRIIFFSSATEP